MDELSFEQEFYFQWHITEKCNLRCKHCYHDSYSSDNELSSNELLMVEREIEKALIAWGKIGSVSLTGGEPFMRRDDIFMVMDLLDSSPVIGYYDILTNGSLIKNEDLSQLRCQKKLRRIQLSLESPDPLINDAIRVEGAFNTTIDIIRRLKDLGFQVGIMMTVSRLNMNNIEDMVNLLVEEKVDTLSVERFIPEGAGSAMNESMLSQEEARRLFEKIYSLGINESRIRILMYRPLFAIIESNDPTVGAMCSVGMNALTIMHDGTIFPCRRLPLPIGHVLNGGIFKAWYDSDLLWEIRQSGNLKGKCGECELIPLCRGCRAMAYYVTGDYLEEDPHCWKVMVAGTN